MAIGKIDSIFCELLWRGVRTESMLRFNGGEGLLERQGVENPSRSEASSRLCNSFYYLLFL